MAIFKCLYCGKEFKAKPSANRKYCSKECANLASKGKSNLKNSKEKVRVVCKVCGKEEYVRPSRAETYVTCSKECMGKYNSERYSQKIKCTCPICGKEFEMKPSAYARIKTQPCCSATCANELKRITYLGENNHQYGLIGDKNSSFVGKEIVSNLGYILEYCPGHPKPCDKSNKGVRVRQHRLVIERNYDKFNPEYFEEIDGWVVLKDMYDVHHINEIKTDNRLENLQILTRSEHSILHNKQRSEIVNKYKQIVAVLKQGELLEHPEVDNQQPSLDSNILEGSETNSRVLIDNAKDSNADTSALLQQLKDIVGEDIVRTVNITETEITELEDKEPLG